MERSDFFWQLCAGMDDDVMLANVRRLYESSWAGLRDATLPMAARDARGLGNYGIPSFRTPLGDRGFMVKSDFSNIPD